MIAFIGKVESIMQFLPTDECCDAKDQNSNAEYQRLSIKAVQYCVGIFYKPPRHSFVLSIEGFLRLAAEGFNIVHNNMSRFFAVIFHIAFKLNVGGIGY